MLFILKNRFKKKNFLFNPKFIIIILKFFIIFTFLSSDGILFYIFFEISMIPTLLLILCWGKQPERIQASIYFFVYTLIGSFPFLSKLIFLRFHKYFNINFCFLWFNPKIKVILNLKIISFFFIFVFLIKLPIFGVHL